MTQPLLDLRDVVLGTGYQLFTKTLPKRLLEIAAIMSAWKGRNAVITLSSDLSDLEPTVKAAYPQHEVQIARSARGPYLFLKEADGR
jgi:hypothetical protein